MHDPGAMNKIILGAERFLRKCGEANMKKKITVPDIINKKKNGEKIVVMTAYSANMAALIAPHADMILVGDSCGMTLHGFSNTISVTVDMIEMSAQAVRRGAPDAFIIADLPFGSYESDKRQAFDTAVRLLRTGACNAVKPEGGFRYAEMISHLTARGIPVVGHVGLEPQAILNEGDYRAKGKNGAERSALLTDIRSVAQAGAFCVVAECVSASVTASMRDAVSVPLIGIGSGENCDGQVLVTDDLIGLTEKTPRFVKRYANIREIISDACERFSQEVKSGAFPQPEHGYFFSEK